MRIVKFVVLLSLLIQFSLNSFSQIDRVYNEVDHVFWVVRDLKAVKKGWASIGFSEIEDFKKIKLTSHGLRDEKGSIKASFAYLGGLKALWVQPVKGETVFSKYLSKHGEGALALIHRVNDEEQLHEIIQQLARVNIGKIATYTLHTKTGDLKYTIMDTQERGTYYLGFVLDQGTRRSDKMGANQMDMKFNQYAFAITEPAPVSSFWASAGLPVFEITHGELWEKEYFGRPADFDVKLGWQRHGSIIYEWCMPLKPPTVYSDHIRQHGEGIQHFGFAVDDMDEAIDFFDRKEYKVSMSGGWGEKGKKGSGRFAYIDLSKIGGMTIELLWSFKE